MTLQLPRVSYALSVLRFSVKDFVSEYADPLTGSRHIPASSLPSGEPSPRLSLLSTFRLCLLCVRQG